MKKIVALALAMMLVLAMGSTALAADLTIDKGYAVTGSSSDHPADDVQFTVVTSMSEYYFNNKTAQATGSSVPQITVSTDAATEGANNTSNAAKLKIEYPSFTAPGEYVYYLTETGTTAGVTYRYDGTGSNYLTVKVTVIHQDNDPTKPLVVGGVAVREGINPNPQNENHSSGKLSQTVETDNANSSAHNTYENGKLTVTKTVTGNQADTTKDWIFKVTLTPKAGTTVRGTVTIDGDGTYVGTAVPTADATTGVVTNNTPAEKKIAAGWNSAQEVYFTLKHGQSLSFDNIPAGVTWKVEEVEENAYGYTTTTPAKQTDTMTTAGATAAYTNDKGIDPDTGITLESVPYIMILAVAMMGVMVIISRKRREEM